MAKRRKIGAFRRAVRAFVKRRQEGVKRAQREQRARDAAQREVIRASCITAGEARARGYEWAGQGLPDSTVVQPVRTASGWEYVPVRTNGRTERVPARPVGTAERTLSRCGAPTATGRPCKRIGDCPDHRTWRKNHRNL